MGFFTLLDTVTAAFWINCRFPLPPMQCTQRAFLQPVKRNSLKISSSASKYHIMKLPWEDGFLNERPKLYKLETAGVPQKGQVRPWRGSSFSGLSTDSKPLGTIPLWWIYPSNTVPGEGISPGPLRSHMKPLPAHSPIQKPRSQVISRTVFLFQGWGQLSEFWGRLSHSSPGCDNPVAQPERWDSDEDTMPGFRITFPCP